MTTATLTPTTKTARRRPATGQDVQPADLPPAPTPRPGRSNRLPSLTAALGLVGLRPLEPVILASLATATPLLLIGTHGSAKSLLLERVAQALNLSWRHYNAALVNFDDLVGYPLPDDKGQLRFVQTPASVWGAQAVFIDEISRARLDVQNRLFPIIHERRVQGIALEGLEHRWAAMNPPSLDPDDSDPGYTGCQPLDVALADRFALHVTMPDWRGFSAEQQEAVILAAAQQTSSEAAKLWQQAVQRAQELEPLVWAQWQRSLARYVRVLADLLQQASAVVSARRAGMLARNASAVHAARLALGECSADMVDSAWLATLNSLPFAATGKAVDPAKLLMAHKEAWRQAKAAADDPLNAILAQGDPLKRLQMAVAASGLPDGEFTTIVTDCLTQAASGARHAMAQWLFESPVMERLSVVAVDAIGEIVRDVVCVTEIAETGSPYSARFRLWQRVIAKLSEIPASGAGIPRTNLLVSLFASGQLTAIEDFTAALKAYDRAAGLLGLEVAA